MKKIVILILFCHSLHGQISGYVEYNYSVVHVMDYQTKSILKFNSNKSSFKTFRAKDTNDSLPKLISPEGKSYNYFVNKDSKNKPTFFTDKENNVLISKVWKFHENHILTESIPIIPWEILPEYKMLSKFRCQKAVGNFRGRTYTVWFAEAIPVSFGPWKLQGLPGLILEAQDDKDIYFYRATIVKLGTEETIDFPDLNNAVTLKTFVTEIEPEKWQTVKSKSQAQLDRSITLESSVDVDRTSLKEVIYEWEEEGNQD